MTEYEAVLVEYEGELARAWRLLEETVNGSREAHKGEEAAIALKAEQLAAEREETQRSFDASSAALNARYEDVRAKEAQLAELRIALECREADVVEAEARLAGEPQSGTRWNSLARWPPGTGRTMTSLPNKRR